MDDTKLLQTADSLRLNPLNRVAALKLRAAGLQENASVLPVFQLMTWGLVHCSCLDHRYTASELRQLVRRPDQQGALDYLLDQVPGGATAFQRKLLRLPPRAAAWALLGVFDMRLRGDPCRPCPRH